MFNVYQLREDEKAFRELVERNNRGKLNKSKPVIKAGVVGYGGIVEDDEYKAAIQAAKQVGIAGFMPWLQDKIEILRKASE